MTIRFWKMSGAGNDFIVMPCVPEDLPEGPASFVRRVCRRGLSVGADGVLFVTLIPGGSAASLDGDAVLVHYNSDGGRSDFCGNGSRCAARFAVMMGVAASPLRLRTDIGVLLAEVDAQRERVRIEAPTPSVPARRRCEVGGRAYEGWFVLAGVPHMVLPVDSPETVDVASLGARLRSHPAMGTAGANVDFLGPLVAGKRRLRTFERGVEGETLACGSGALAAAAVLAREGETSPVVLTPTSGLDLEVDFQGGTPPRAFHLTGEARIVFEGVLSAGPGQDIIAP